MYESGKVEVYIQTCIPYEHTAVYSYTTHNTCRTSPQRHEDSNSSDCRNGGLQIHQQLIGHVQAAHGNETQRIQKKDAERYRLNV